MSPLERLLNKNKRLKTIPDSFIERLKLIQRGQFTLLVAKMKSAQLKGEALSTSKANFQLIEEVKNVLKNDLLTGDYYDNVKQFHDEFDKQKKANNGYYDTISKEYSTEVGDAVVKQIQKQTVQALISDSVDTSFLTPLEGILTNAISSGAGFVDTIKYINTFIEGDEESYGAIQKYASQIAHDSFANSDRAYGNAISDDLELEFYLYAGDEFPTTRCFCAERHNKYYHWKEIAAWGRGENVGSCDFPWQGMNRATNETTIFNYAGGYNCQHVIAGVSTFSVPSEDFIRNVENGNYNPSEYEREFFGIN